MGNLANVVWCLVPPTPHFAHYIKVLCMKSKDLHIDVLTITYLILLANLNFIKGRKNNAAGIHPSISDNSSLQNVF